MKLVDVPLSKGDVQLLNQKSDVNNFSSLDVKKNF